MTDSLSQLMSGLWGSSTPATPHASHASHAPAAPPPPAAPGHVHGSGAGSHPFSGVIEGGVGSAALGQLFNGLMGRAPQAGPQGAAVVGLLGYLMGGRGGLSGLQLLADRLREAGLGAQVDSWISHASNVPVAPEQLERAFPAEALEGVERHTGLDHRAVLAQLSRGLPQMMDRLTPEGRMPAADAEMSKEHPDHLLEGFGLAGKR